MKAAVFEKSGKLKIHDKPIPSLEDGDVLVKTILCGICIGEAAVIGAGSVVTKNVPAGEVWLGNPAKVLRKV